MNSLLQRGARGGGQRTHRVPERADCHVHHWSFLEWVPCHVVLREALVDVELSNQDSIAVVTYGYTVFTDGCFGRQSPLPAGSAAFLFLSLRLPLLDNNLVVSGNDRLLLAVVASGLSGLRLGDNSRNCFPAGSTRFRWQRLIILGGGGGGGGGGGAAPLGGGGVCGVPGAAAERERRVGVAVAAAPPPPVLLKSSSSLLRNWVYISSSCAVMGRVIMSLRSLEDVCAFRSLKRSTKADIQLPTFCGRGSATANSDAAYRRAVGSFPFLGIRRLLKGIVEGSVTSHAEVSMSSSSSSSATAVVSRAGHAPSQSTSKDLRYAMSMTMRGIIFPAAAGPGSFVLATNDLLSSSYCLIRSSVNAHDKCFLKFFGG